MRGETKLQRFERLGLLGPIIPRSELKRYSMSVWQTKNKELLKQKGKARYVRRYHSYYRNLKARIAAKRVRHCKLCRAEFTFVVGGPHRRFCSEKCACNHGRIMQRLSDKRRRSTVQGRLQESVRSTVRDYMTRRRLNYGKRLWPALGYTVDQLRIRLEQFFTPETGFDWSNYGKVWQIDHIIPQSKFHFTSMNDAEFRACWSLSNLAPIERRQNSAKGNRYIGQFDRKGQLCFIV